MYIKVNSQNQGDAGNIVTKCPICGNGGTFDRLQNLHDLFVAENSNSVFMVGQRKCPNIECCAHIFFIKARDGSLVTYPALRIDFNSDNIPPALKTTFEEAITCHANECYAAAAIMVRRTLEELCDDKHCQGGNLKQRIEELKSSVVLPNELFEALDELRLLGNDAAHVESKEYDTVGKEEVSVAIELAKEILKSVYQMNSLVKRLKGLKKA